MKADARRRYDDLSASLRGSDLGRRLRHVHFPLAGDKDQMGGLVAALLDGVETAGEVVVDVGCGRGGTLAAVKGARIVSGIDLSFEAVAFASTLGLPVLQADAEQLCLASGAVGVLINLESSIHYPDVVAFYTEVSRVLRPGGRLAHGDFVPTSATAAHDAAIEAAGMRIDRRSDVTDAIASALQGRTATGAALRRSGVTQDFADRVDDDERRFAALLESGEYRYLLTHAVKVAEAGPAEPDIVAALRASADRSAELLSWTAA